MVVYTSVCVPRSLSKSLCRARFVFQNWYLCSSVSQTDWHAPLLSVQNSVLLLNCCQQASYLHITHPPSPYLVLFLYSLSLVLCLYSLFFFLYSPAILSGLFCCVLLLLCVVGSSVTILENVLPNVSLEGALYNVRFRVADPLHNKYFNTFNNILPHELQVGSHSDKPGYVINTADSAQLAADAINRVLTANPAFAVTPAGTDSLFDKNTYALVYAASATVILHMKSEYIGDIGDGYHISRGYYTTRDDNAAFAFAFIEPGNIVLWYHVLFALSHCEVLPLLSVHYYVL